MAAKKRRKKVGTAGAETAQVQEVMSDEASDHIESDEASDHIEEVMSDEASDETEGSPLNGASHDQEEKEIMEDSSMESVPTDNEAASQEDGTKDLTNRLKAMHQARAEEDGRLVSPVAPEGAAVLTQIVGFWTGEYGSIVQGRLVGRGVIRSKSRNMPDNYFYIMEMSRACPGVTKEGDVDVGQRVGISCADGLVRAGLNDGCGSEYWIKAMDKVSIDGQREVRRFDVRRLGDLVGEAWPEPPLVLGSLDEQAQAETWSF